MEGRYNYDIHGALLFADNCQPVAIGTLDDITDTITTDAPDDTSPLSISATRDFSFEFTVKQPHRFRRYMAVFMGFRCPSKPRYKTRSKAIRKYFRAITLVRCRDAQRIRGGDTE